MSLKRELSQASAGSPPACKAPRLTLAVHVPSSPEPISMAPTTVVSPTADDHVPSPPFLAAPYPVPRAPFGVNLDPAQLVAQLEDLAEEYERSVDEMGAEIEDLRRQVRAAQRALYATPSLEDCDRPSFLPPSFASTRPTDGIGLPNPDMEAPVSATGAGLKGETLSLDIGEGEAVEGDAEGVEGGAEGVKGGAELVKGGAEGENEGVAGSQTA